MKYIVLFCLPFLMSIGTASADKMDQLMQRAEQIHRQQELRKRILQEIYTDRHYKLPPTGEQLLEQEKES